MINRLVWVTVGTELPPSRLGDNVLQMQLAQRGGISVEESEYERGIMTRCSPASTYRQFLENRSGSGVGYAICR